MNFINFYIFLQNKYFYYIKIFLKKKIFFNNFFWLFIFYYYIINWCWKQFLKKKFSYLWLSIFQKKKIQQKLFLKEKIISKYYNINKRVHLLYKKRKKIKLIMRLRRKNLFLTILNNDGDIISKTNIGSCGFKKRVKFTGFALQNTMRIFAEKIIKILQDDWNNKINIIWIKYLNLKKKNSQKFFRSKKRNKILRLKRIFLSLKKKYIYRNKKKKYIYITKRNKKKKYIYITKRNKKKKKIYNNKQLKKKQLLKINWKSFIRSQKNKNRYIYIIKYSEKKKFYLKLFYYRHYKLYRSIHLEFFKKKILKHYLFLDLILKNNIKFWAFRYIFRGFRKLKIKFMQIKNKKPAIHSKGFRLKKKRRL